MGIQKEKTGSVTWIGIVAALIFGCGPFLYLNILGRGIFLYLMVLFIGIVCIQAIIPITGVPKISLSSTEKMLFVTFLWQTVTRLWTPAGPLAGFYEHLKVIALYFLLVLPVYKKNDKKLMYLAVILIAIYCVSYLTSADALFNDEGTDGDRKTIMFFGIKQDPNYFCFMFIVPFVYCLSMALNNKKNMLLRGVCVGVLIALLYGVLLTGSRGGLLGIAAATFVYIITYQKKKVKAILLLLIVFILLIYAFNNIHLFLPENLVERFSVENVMESGGSGRTEIWTDYLTTLFKNPLEIMVGFGYGAGSHMMYMAAHSYWIDNLFNYGVVGLILIIWFWVAMLKQAAKNKNWISFSSICGILMLATTLSVGTILQFWLAVSIVGVMNKSEEESLKESYKRELL